MAGRFAKGQKVRVPEGLDVPWAHQYAGQVGTATGNVGYTDPDCDQAEFGGRLGLFAEGELEAVPQKPDVRPGDTVTVRVSENYGANDYPYTITDTKAWEMGGQVMVGPLVLDQEGIEVLEHTPAPKRLPTTPGSIVHSGNEAPVWAMLHPDGRWYAKYGEISPDGWQDGWVLVRDAGKDA